MKRYLRLAFSLLMGELVQRVGEAVLIESLAWFDEIMQVEADA